MMAEFKDNYIQDTVDNMEAILFTGDRLIDENEEIDKLLEILKNWEKQLVFLKVANSEEHKEEEENDSEKKLLVSLSNRIDCLQIVLHTYPCVTIIRLKNRIVPDDFENILYKSIGETKTMFNGMNDYISLKDKINNILVAKRLNRPWKEEFTFKY